MWKEIGQNKLDTPRIWSFETEKEIEGKYIGKNEKTGKMQSNLYVIEVNGENVGIWGGSVIDTKLSQIKEGERIRIIYNGDKVGKSGRKYNDFSVFVDIDETSEVLEDIPEDEASEDDEFNI